MEHKIKVQEHWGKSYVLYGFYLVDRMMKQYECALNGY